MVDLVNEKVHGLANFGGRPIWVETSDGITTCSYCGSMSPKDALAELKNHFGTGSGSDWIYGWPHKFYLGDYKFYSKHLLGATLQEFIDLSALLREKLGIWFRIEGEDLTYTAPYDNYQTWFGKTYSMSKAPEDHKILDWSMYE